MITSVIVFLLVLGLLVVVHELGHFLVAKFFRVGVDEFGIGFPPRIGGIRFGKTLYSVNWIPIGGFVKIKGVVGGDQMNDDSGKALGDAQEDDNFSQKPIWQRFLILFAGIAMNIGLAGVLLSVGFMIGLPSSLESLPVGASVSNEEVIAIDFSDNSTAQQEGLLVGDILRVIDGRTIKSGDDLQGVFHDVSDEDVVTVTLERSVDELIEIQVPVQNLGEGQYGIGVYYAESGIAKLPWYRAIYEGPRLALNLTEAVLLGLADTMMDVFNGNAQESSVAGPVGIASLTHQATQLGVVYVLQFAALLSVNLAIFNLLPIPALDGGRIAFVGYELIFRKPINQKVEAIVHNIGFLLLLLLILAVTIKDVFSFF